MSAVDSGISRQRWVQRFAAHILAEWPTDVCGVDTLSEVQATEVAEEAWHERDGTSTPEDAASAEVAHLLALMGPR